MQTLLLDAAYRPIGTISWQEAIQKVMKGTVIVLEEYDQEVRSAYMVWKVPCVVALLKWQPTRKRIKFNRKNIYLRDEFTCQFCGKNQEQLRDGIKSLTFDHVLPRSRGGKTSWENIVTACLKCNGQKAARTPQEAGMKLKRLPVEPKHLKMYAVPEGRPNTPEQWRSYLYWETQLDP
jgi:5-methylcytosine-specific restriction endonuclease McrA